MFSIQPFGFGNHFYFLFAFYCLICVFLGIIVYANFKTDNQHINNNTGKIMYWDQLRSPKNNTNIVIDINE